MYGGYFALMLGGMAVTSIAILLVPHMPAAARRWSEVAVAATLLGPVLTLGVQVAGLPEGIDILSALLLTPIGFAIGAIGAARRLDDRWQSFRIALAAAGLSLALLAAYGAFALVVTSIEGRNPPYQGAVEDVVLRLSGLVMALAAVRALTAAIFEGRRPRPHA